MLLQVNQKQDLYRSKAPEIMSINNKLDYCHLQTLIPVFSTVKFQNTWNLVSHFFPQSFLPQLCRTQLLHNQTGLYESHETTVVLALHYGLHHCFVRSLAVKTIKTHTLRITPKQYISINKYQLKIAQHSYCAAGLTWTSSSFRIGMDLTLYFWRSSLDRGEDIIFLRMCDGALKCLLRFLRREEVTNGLIFMMAVEKDDS